MNLTDVDDKTIKHSKKEGISLNEYTKKYKKAFFEDLKKLNIEKADVFPEATKHIKEMVNLIKKLLKKGYAYSGNDKSIYYNISKFKGYGKLSHLKIKGLKGGARVKQDEYGKENVNDFALWKAWDKEDGGVLWETEIGSGRPGWHVECSAMSMKYLGNHFDIHTGGIDLIFPHHENEIAQSEAATGEKFVNFWVHNEWLLVNNKKMSKSLGNFYTLKDLLKKGYDTKAIRYILMSTHYRQHLNFTLNGLEAAKNAVDKLTNFIVDLKNIKKIKEVKIVPKLIKKVKTDFEKAMNDDLNMPLALASIFNFVKEINKADIGKDDAEKVLKVMKEFDTVLGIMKIKKKVLSEEIKKLINEREKARKEKNWKLADQIREKLRKNGVILEDTREGVIWKFA